MSVHRKHGECLLPSSPSDSDSNLECARALLGPKSPTARARSGRPTRRVVALILVAGIAILCVVGALTFTRVSSSLRTVRAQGVPAHLADLAAALDYWALSATAHRCDLRDWRYLAPSQPNIWRGAEWNYGDNGRCHQYNTSATPPRHYWDSEIVVARNASLDAAYLSVFHVQHIDPLVNADTGGHMFVIQENCYRRPQLVERDLALGQWLDRMYGPASLELRLNGTELHTLPLSFVHPDYYGAAHRAVMRHGPVRSALFASERFASLTGEMVVDRERLASTANYSDSADWPGSADAEGHRHSQIGVMNLKTGRVHGVDRCLYEVDYSVSLTGVYDLQLYLLHTDYEDIGHVGHRQPIHAPQNTVVLTQRGRTITRDPWNVWPHPLDHSLYPNLYQRSGAYDSDRRTGPSHSDPQSLKQIYFTERQFVPNASSIIVDYQPLSALTNGTASSHGWSFPMAPHPGYEGRWVNVAEARIYNNRTVTTSLMSSVWWSNNNRTSAVAQYSQERPPFAFCDTNPAQYEYVPYRYDQPKDSTAVYQAQSSSIPLSSQPLSFPEIRQCLARRRIAFLGDSQTRNLVGRFVSTFVGSSFKFAKQRFWSTDIKGGASAVEGSWQCSVITVPDQRQTRAGSAASEGVEQFAHKLPVADDASNDTTVTLSDEQFELCYFPFSHMRYDELFNALTDDRQFDLVVFNTGQHPAAHGHHLGHYHAKFNSEFATLEQRLTDIQSMLNTGQQSVSQWLRSKLLWWSSLPFPRNREPDRLPSLEHRYGRLVSMFNDGARAFFDRMNVSHVDFAEAVTAPFIDCASDGAHQDWPFTDVVFTQIVDAVTRHLHCCKRHANPRDSLLGGQTGVAVD